MTTAETTPRGDTKQDGPRLHGSLGTLETFFSVMSYNAPLVVVMGIIPVMLVVGNGIGTPIVFVVAGLVLAAFASGYIRMSASLPRPGGFYSLITAGLGREIGLGAGLVTAALVYFLLAAATIAFGGIVLGAFISETLNGPELPWYVCGIVFWVATCVLGYLRIDLSAKITTVLLLLEIVVVAVYDAGVVISGGGPDGFSAAPFSPDHYFDGSFAVGILFAMGMFGGFEVAVLLRDEVRNPDRTIPRATYGVIVVAGVLYTLTTWLFINSIGPDDAIAVVTKDLEGTMRSSMEQYAGKFILDVGTILVLTSSFAVILCAHNVAARYLFNLSADGIVPKSLSGVHAEHKSPHVASLTVSVACLAVLVPVIASGVDVYAFYAGALGIVAVGMLVVFLLCNIAVMRYLRTAEPDAGTFRTTVLPLVAMIGLGATVVLALRDFPVLTGGSDFTSNVLLGAFVLTFLAGVALAAVYRRRRPDVYQRIGRQ